MYDLGETTSDLRALGIPHPVETAHGLPDSDREDRIRRNGTYALAAGIALLALDAIVTLGLLAYGLYKPDGHPATRQVINLSIIVTGMIATALLTTGLIERQLRQPRTLIRRAMARADANATVGDGNREAIEELTKRVDKLITVVEGGVADVGKVQAELVEVQAKLAAVPDYGQGLAQGARIAGSVLGLEGKG